MQALFDFAQDDRLLLRSDERGSDDLDFLFLTLRTLYIISSLHKGHSQG
jgi:hypothetical protein